MNTAEAFIRGASSFYAGQKRNPSLDPLFHPFTNPSTPKNIDMLCNSWLKGWDDAKQEILDAEDMADHESAAKAEALNEQILTHGAWQFDPIADLQERHERWLDDLQYQAQLKQVKETVKPQEGVTLNEDGSVTLSADWIMRNAE